VSLDASGEVNDFSGSCSFFALHIKLARGVCIEAQMRAPEFGSWLDAFGPRGKGRGQALCEIPVICDRVVGLIIILT
jgi:hypothetical protein